MMTSERAATVLRGLHQNALVCEAEEIDELLALGLAIEADPEDLAMLGWLQPVVRELTRLDVGDPNAVPALQELLVRTNNDLSSDWYRMTTSAASRARREADKVAIQRALGLLRDPPLVQALRKLVLDMQQMAPHAPWVSYPQLGVEQYAITVKGHRVLRSLMVRLERFAKVPFKSFLHSFDKVATKMRAFGTEVMTLSNNIGYVRKNREHVVIGLVKTGVPAGHALGAYHSAMSHTQAPDTAVTCARHAATFGGPGHAAMRLRMAQLALRQAGYPDTPIAMGAAKSLLPFNPPQAGIPRFTELMRRLEQAFGRSEMLFKHTARLMPASGEPAEIVHRVVSAAKLLEQFPSHVRRASDYRIAATALGAMARSVDGLPELVRRFRELEHRLVSADISKPDVVEADALECIGCAGTPAEVVDTVLVLIDQLTEGHRPERGHVAIAAAFAKRFAY